MDYELILPYRTDWREMSRVLDYCKGKGSDRSVLDARFGGGESLRETLNALEQLGLISRNDAGDVRLTPFGERLAYASSDAESRRILVEAMLGYPPYRIPLERAVDEKLSLLDAPGVERIWQVDMRLGQPRNRVEEARTFFFRLADDAGLGTYRRGVRGQTTRLELKPGFGVLVKELLFELADAPVRPEEELEPPQLHARDTRAPASAPDILTAVGSSQPIRINPSARAARPETNLSIQVDMSDWDLDRIEAFLLMIGYLDES